MRKRPRVKRRKVEAAPRPLHDLPLDMQREVAGFLDLRSLAALACVDRHFASLLREEAARESGVWSRHLPEWPEDSRHLLPLRTPEAYLSAARYAPLVRARSPVHPFLVITAHESGRCPPGWRSAAEALAGFRSEDPATRFTEFRGEDPATRFTLASLPAKGQIVVSAALVEAALFRRDGSIGYRVEIAHEMYVELRRGVEISFWLFLAPYTMRSGLTKVRDVMILHDAGFTPMERFVDGLPHGVSAVSNCRVSKRLSVDYEFTCPNPPAFRFHLHRFRLS